MSLDNTLNERLDIAGLVCNHLANITGDHTWRVSDDYGWQLLIYNDDGKGIWMSNAANKTQWHFNQSPIKLPGYMNGVIPSRTEILSANISKEKSPEKIADEVYRRLLCKEKAGFWEVVNESIKEKREYEQAAEIAFDKLLHAGFDVRNGYGGKRASDRKAEARSGEARISVESWGGTYGFNLKVNYVSAEQAIAIVKAIGAVK